MNKIIGIEEAISKIKDGDVIMVGGFLACGSPIKLIDALAESGKKNLTLICNDTAYVDKGVGKLVVNKQFKKIIASHIGTNKETGNQMNSGETEVILTPQGTLAEQIRAYGAGLGGVLTQTGVGTKVEEGKQTIELNGKKYIIEEPLKANVALIYGTVIDKAGNINFHGSTQNFNTVMATAADLVIAEAEKIVEVGEINQDWVKIPGIFVDYIVDGGNK